MSGRCSSITVENKIRLSLHHPLRRNLIYQTTHLVMGTEIPHRCRELVFSGGGWGLQPIDSVLALEVQMATSTNERLNGRVEHLGCIEAAAEWEQKVSLRQD